MKTCNTCEYCYGCGTTKRERFNSAREYRAFLAEDSSDCSDYSAIKRYVITGTKKDGKRFRMHSTDLSYAMGINLWKGAVWEVSDSGRKLLKRVSN
jgi:hypothetical protein